MTVILDPAYMQKLLAVAEKNKEAGDWVTDPLSESPINVAQPVDDLLKRIGNTKIQVDRGK